MNSALDACLEIFDIIQYTLSHVTDTLTIRYTDMLGMRFKFVLSSFHTLSVRSVQVPGNLYIRSAVLYSDF